MNHDKKRKRQNGRQTKLTQDCYQVWIDDDGKVHSKLVKARKKATDFTPIHGKF